LIIGSGDVLDILKQNVKDFGIEDKVIFKGRMPYAEMMAHTQLADLGLTLDKDTNINYRYSLPNKVFDYIQAGIPVLGSDLVEVKRIVQEFSVGQIVESVEPKAIALAITNMLSSDKVSEWKANCIKASKELSWDVESEVLREMIIGIDG
jgi:glycosyltransferase involved in cell wall biosynthesis